MAYRTRAQNRSQPLNSDSFAGADDAELGIGEGADTEASDLDALMSNPAFAALVDKAVAARMGTAGPKAERSSDAVFQAYLDQFAHLLEASAEQKPGYQKPLTAVEIDARKAGRTEMFALIRKFKTENVWPHYLLSDEANPFYGPSPNGDILYKPGQEIKTRQPPAEGFRPLNDPAMQVYAAYRQWVGEPVSMEDLTAQAVMEAQSVEPMTKVGLSKESDVILVDAPVRDMKPKRTLGTATPELVGKTMPAQPGQVAQPVGPFEVGE